MLEDRWEEMDQADLKLMASPEPDADGLPWCNTCRSYHGDRVACITDPDLVRQIEIICEED